MPRLARLPLLALGMIALLAGMWAGLLRLGWAWPTPRETFGLAHGPLMIGGFLGTLIGLERAVALGRGWAYTAPLCSALAVLAMLLAAPHWVAPMLATAASAVLIGVFATVMLHQTTFFIVTMGLGAVSWLIGNAIWLAGGEIPVAVSWWLGFPVLTIAGERLELSRMRRLTPAGQAVFVVVITVLSSGFVAGGITTDAGGRITGAGLLGLSAWFAHNDIARRTIRHTGLPRFTAACLLSGYVWLALGGALAIAYGSVVAGPHYDAVLHALLLGFVFTMIFGHAPIIFPAVLGLAVPFRSLFYAHLIVLHVSVAVRIFGGVAGVVHVRQWGGVLNALAVVFFLVNTVGSLLRERRLAIVRRAATLARA
jgi:hypothetical protein